MKRYLYSLLIAAAAVATVACSEDEGTTPGSDAAPMVTIYTYDAPSGYNADESLTVRPCPNSRVDAMYILAELKADKEAYVTANGEDAYNRRVVAEGDPVEAGEDVVLSGLQGLYAITVVAVDSAERCYGFETSFKGILWVDGGEAIITQNFANDGVYYCAGYAKVERQDEANIFRVVDPFHQIAPDVCPSNPASVLTFSFDEAGELTDFESSLGSRIYLGFEDSGVEWHFLWDPSNYGSYCYLQQGASTYGNCVKVTCVISYWNGVKDVAYYTGGTIFFYTDELVWCE